MRQSAGAPSFREHFDGKRFFNPNGERARGFADVLRWQLNNRREASPPFVDDVKPSQPPARVDGDELRVTMVNHSTVLLQHAGRNILTDPVWGERVSPFSWIGPRRHRAPGVRWEDLPRIDVVLISHNHYDHLELAVVRKLAWCEFVAPKGLARLLKRQGIERVHELDWGEAAETAGLAIHAAPAMHFSARGLFDRNRTLWCGFAMETARGVVYFAGDTGFGDHFAAIRERYGAPRLALLPIGAYEPRWFMSPVHMGPAEAARAHEMLGAEKSVAIHHGTFQLADEGIDTPGRELARCAPGDSFVVLANGESVTLT